MQQIPAQGLAPPINIPSPAHSNTCAAISRNSHQGDVLLGSVARFCAIREKGDMTNLLIMAYQVVNFHFYLLGHRYEQLKQEPPWKQIRAVSQEPVIMENVKMSLIYQVHLGNRKYYNTRSGILDFDWSIVPLVSLHILFSYNCKNI